MKLLLIYSRKLNTNAVFLYKDFLGTCHLSLYLALGITMSLIIRAVKCKAAENPFVHKKQSIIRGK